MRLAIVALVALFVGACSPNDAKGCQIRSCVKLTCAPTCCDTVETCCEPTPIVRTCRRARPVVISQPVVAQPVVCQPVVCQPVPLTLACVTTSRCRPILGGTVSRSRLAWVPSELVQAPTAAEELPQPTPATP